MDIRTYKRIAVFDWVLRLIHAWNGAIVVGLITLGWLQKTLAPGAARASVVDLHVALGFGLCIGLVARLVWGVAGPEHARLQALWHPTAWIGFFLARRAPHLPMAGHDRRATGAYLAFYLLAVAMVTTGLTLAGRAHNRGPLAAALFDTIGRGLWLERLHEWGLYAMTAFICMHLAAMALAEKRRGYPVAQGMVSGYQYVPIPAVSPTCCPQNHEDATDG